MQTLFNLMSDIDINHTKNQKYHYLKKTIYPLLEKADEIIDTHNNTLQERFRKSININTLQSLIDYSYTELYDNKNEVEEIEYAIDYLKQAQLNLRPKNYQNAVNLITQTTYDYYHNETKDETQTPMLQIISETTLMELDKCTKEQEITDLYIMYRDYKDGIIVAP